MRTLVMILVLAASAASMVTGRVTDSYGRGVGKVYVTVSGQGIFGSEQETVLTSPFGYYISNIFAYSGTSIVPHSRKMLLFQPSARIIISDSKVAFGQDFLAWRY